MGALLVAVVAVAAAACGPAAKKDASGPSGADGAGDGDGTDPFEGTDGADGQDGEDGVDGGTEGPADGADGSSDGDAPPPLDPNAGFPSPELYLQIVGPSAEDHVSTGGGVTYLAGVMFGNPDKIVWQSSTGQSGTAEGGAFWKTGPITLAPGDNDVVVKAILGDEESVDTIRIIYNPGFYFATQPVARPSAFFTGPATNVVVTLGIRTKNIVPQSVTLWEVDELGNTLGKLGTMADNGDTSDPNCDEIQDDGVYSRCAKLQSATPALKRLRVSLQIAVDGAVYTVYSPVAVVEVVDTIPVSECEAMHQLQKDAKALYLSELAGSGNPTNAAGTVVSMLKASPLVADAGVNASGRGVWTEYASGVLAALNLPATGTRGSGEAEGHATQTGALVGNTVNIESKNALMLAPFRDEFGVEDEVPEIAQLLSAQQCPEFKVDGPHQGAQATLRRLRQAHEYGVIAISTHADTYFGDMDPAHKAGFGWEHDGSQEILWTGEPVACGAFLSAMTACSSDAACGAAAECVLTKASGATTSGVCVDHTQIDLRRGRVVMGADTWGVHPAFFPKHAKRQWPSTLVYLGGCRTLYNGTLAGELFAAGAKAIAGFTDYVHTTFVSSQATAWFEKMLTEGLPAGYGALFPTVDPESPTGQFRLFGGTNVLITDANILNAGFEKGDTTGWNVEGDGRVISQLGISVPVSGKFMGILSTGLGYTQQTGELSQSFCIPEGIQTLSFFWKFFSEEFTEWCGSQYQDTFQATLESAGGKITLVDVKVDDLCGKNDGECFGQCGSQYVGLIPSDVSFDQGGVFNIQWQLLEKDVSQLAGKGPVTLKLFSTDQGDSIYDTVILIDSIQFD